MTYHVYAEKSVHDSESKFYQVFRITFGKRGVIVTHWGKNSEGATMVPRLHGQRKVETHDSGCLSAYSSIRRGKMKRGYSTWELTHDAKFEKIEDLGEYLLVLFKKEDAEAILAYMDKDDDLDPVGVPVDDEPVESESVSSEEYAGPIESSTHEEWASW